ncbi:enoyl-CoA hydratase [Halalkalibacter krulwichiae]|uniref:2,3-dehydroadipyl-CoA hydratase n=1 Tax=Halalkalibacter krulwichiae TaxID=199441 RepID=A0A1X9MAF0_9BACI|nr:enoyl-CoA hydratase [Halalkalibacter krulwichiae]ARK29143.1 2,3-dehydroadipyl-CoA hydratase [Halalkalibacter krulwichiae]
MKTLLIENKGNGIVVATLNQPKKANALSLQMIRELNDFLASVENDDSIRVIVFTGNGDRVFCAGADLKERKEMNMQEAKFAVQKIKRTINRVASLKQPTIAAMNGTALGGGLEFSLACDIRIASTDGTYGLTETSLAIIPGAGGTQRLSRLIGTGKAKELIFTAAKISGIEAKEIGLVEHAVRLNEVKQKSIDLAQVIASNGPVAVQEAKKAINLGIDVDLKTSLTIESNAYEQTLITKDRLEGLLAFEEKRKPEYKGQ